MPGTKPRKTVAILGGGIAGLATAFALTEDKVKQDHDEDLRVVIYQPGWRLGGKCASSRNDEIAMRIEEHGIHLFGGWYFNALRLMSDCYEEMTDANLHSGPIDSFERAFLPIGEIMQWEFRDRKWNRWPFSFPDNELSPQTDGDRFPTLASWLERAVHSLVAGRIPGWLSWLRPPARALARFFILGNGRPVLNALWWLMQRLQPVWLHWLWTRRNYAQLDFAFALTRGVLDDRVEERGFDDLDDTPFDEWLARHGATHFTRACPLAFTTPNTLFSYPQGDASRPPTMAAGVYLRWSLQQFAYLGALGYLFAAGTGETVVAPLYEVLKHRGVEFKFFHEITKLALDADGEVETVEFNQQAAVVGDAEYQPLDTLPNGMRYFPKEPLYKQLVDGNDVQHSSKALEAEGLSLESYWATWPHATKDKLTRGNGFDYLVLAMPIKALEPVCGELLAADARWQTMVDEIKTVPTQAMQIWLDESVQELGWEETYSGNNTLLNGSFINPMNALADFHHLIPEENWGANPPRTLFYFCGAMADEPDGPTDSIEYPVRMRRRLKWLGIEFLRAGVGAILPKAVLAQHDPPGGPVGLDFGHLQQPPGGTQPEGVARFESQFWRANVDPSERYTISVPESTAARIWPDESGFTGLVLAGDWTRTGFNLGSVESTVMSAKMAANAILGRDRADGVLAANPAGPPP